jgi:hypothetical protein
VRGLLDVAARTCDVVDEEDITLYFGRRNQLRQSRTLARVGAASPLLGDKGFRDCYIQLLADLPGKEYGQAVRTTRVATRNRYDMIESRLAVYASYGNAQFVLSPALGIDQLQCRASGSKWRASTLTERT